MWKRYFSPITWLKLRRSSLKVTKWIGKLGSEISKMLIIFAPSDRSRDTAHAQWLFQVKVIWSDWVTHNSGTDNCKMLKIGTCTVYAKLNSPDIAKVKEVYQGHKAKWKLCTKVWNIFRKRYRIVEIDCTGVNGRVRFFTESFEIAVSAHAQLKLSYRSFNE